MAVVRDEKKDEFAGKVQLSLKGKTCRVIDFQDDEDCVVVRINFEGFLANNFRIYNQSAKGHTCCLRLKFAQH